MLFAREGAKVLCADLNFEAASTTAQTINDAAGEDLAIAVGVNVADAGTPFKLDYISNLGYNVLLLSLNVPYRSCRGGNVRDS